jgi:hypothetical protein
MSGRQHEQIEVHESEDWSALYVDGVLVKASDPYIIDEWIREHFKVETVQDDAFLGGGRDSLKTLVEVEAYRDARDRRLAEAEEMLQRGKAMVEAAERLAAGDSDLK